MPLCLHAGSCRLMPARIHFLCKDMPYYASFLEQNMSRHATLCHYAKLWQLFSTNLCQLMSSYATAFFRTIMSTHSKLCQLMLNKIRVLLLEWNSRGWNFRLHLEFFIFRMNIRKPSPIFTLISSNSFTISKFIPVLRAISL